jgi:hypothetical protein
MPAQRQQVQSSRAENLRRACAHLARLQLLPMHQLQATAWQNRQAHRRAGQAPLVPQLQLRQLRTLLLLQQQRRHHGRCCAAGPSHLIQAHCTWLAPCCCHSDRVCAKDLCYWAGDSKGCTIWAKCELCAGPRGDEAACAVDNRPSLVGLLAWTIDAKPARGRGHSKQGPVC